MKSFVLRTGTYSGAAGEALDTANTIIVRQATKTYTAQDIQLTFDLNVEAIADHLHILTEANHPAGTNTFSASTSRSFGGGTNTSMRQIGRERAESAGWHGAQKSI